MSRMSNAVAAGLIALAGPAVASAAVITIDTFATPGGQLPVSTQGLSVGAQNAPDAIGGRRDFRITRDTGVIPDFDRVTITQYSSGGTSFLDFDQTSGAKGSLELTYAGTGNLDADLSINRRVLIDLAQFNPGEGAAMTVTLTLFDGVDTVVTSVPTVGSGAQTLTFDFTSPTFTLDFSSIDTITVAFDAPLAADFRVTSLTAPEARVVPEPAGLALLAAGCFVLARRRLS